MAPSKPKVPKAERDRILVAAIRRARNAMILLQGTRVTFGRKSGFLDFENEIFKLTQALQVMGLDTPLPVFPQTTPKNANLTDSKSRADRAGSC